MQVAITPRRSDRVRRGRARRALRRDDRRAHSTFLRAWRRRCSATTRSRSRRSSARGRAARRDGRQMRGRRGAARPARQDLRAAAVPHPRARSARRRRRYTISIDTVEGTAGRGRRGVGYHALKIKVGGADDLERVRAVRREAPDALIRVDANEAWTVQSTAELMPELRLAGRRADRAAAPAADRDGLRQLHAAGLPDPDRRGRELPHPAPTLPPAAGHADGVNIKLTKSGGIREAVRMIHAARALDLLVMLGCMNESVARDRAAPPRSLRWWTLSTSTATC